MTREGFKREGLKKKTENIFQPRRYKFRNQHAALIQAQDFPTIAAEFFAEIQWMGKATRRQPRPNKREIPFAVGANGMNDNKLSFQELNIAINTQKNEPLVEMDGGAELIKWLSDKIEI